MAEAQLPKNMYWNPNSKRWELQGKAKGTVTFFADGAGVGAPNIRTAGVASLADGRIQRLILGTGGTISYIRKFVGTIPLTNFGSNSLAISYETITGATGVAPGDTVIVTPRAANGVDGLIMMEAYVPTNNLLNCRWQYQNAGAPGSLPASGFDVTVIR